MSDSLQKFLFENEAIRGELVELDASWQQILSRHDYPPVVMKLLGEMVSACVLLSATLKFDGSTILQIHGDGPVKLLVAECDAELRVRATAKLAQDDVVPDTSTLDELINAHGRGQCVITLEPKNRQDGLQTYQGIVALGGENIAAIIENYMRTSEQLDTRLWLATDETHCRGLLLQKLPQGEHQEIEALAQYWDHVTTLAQTLKADDLLSLDNETLLHRLYWEENVRIFEPRQRHFHCGCSREKVSRMLATLGREEVDAALAELGSIEVQCDFCGQRYQFDGIDCAQIFLESKSGPTPASGSTTRH